MQVKKIRRKPEACIPVHPTGAIINDSRLSESILRIRKVRCAESALQNQEAARRCPEAGTSAAAAAALRRPPLFGSIAMQSPPVRLYASPREAGGGKGREGEAPLADVASEAVLGVVPQP